MDERRDSGEYYPGGRRGGEAPERAGNGKVDRVNIEEVPERYTEDDMRATLNRVVRALRPVVTCIALCEAACGATVEVQTAPKSEIYNDQRIVTNVVLDVGDKADRTNTYTKAETDARIVELAPPPGNYNAVSNAAMNARAKADLTVYTMADWHPTYSDDIGFAWNDELGLWVGYGGSGFADYTLQYSNTEGCWLYGNTAITNRIPGGRYDLVLNIGTTIIRSSAFPVATSDRLATTSYTDEAIQNAVPSSRRVNGKALSTDITLSASDVGAPTIGMHNAASNLAATADGKATTAIAYLQGDDAKAVVTNYDSAVTMPSASLQQRVEDADGGTNYWKVVWNELTRWNRFTGDGFDWAAWCGFDCFRTNVLAQIDQKADRAWGFYDSHSGNWAPDGYTWISSPKIAIAAGLAYRRTITSEGAVWVLESNGLITETGGNMTNGFFRVRDDEGNALLEIVKGSKRTVGADAGSVTQTIVMGVTHLHITYSVVSESHPTLRICPSLELGEWKSEDASDCVANVSWTGSSGAWVAEVWGKTALPRMFVKAEYEVGGETYIKNSAPISADGGIYCTDGIHKVRFVYNNGSVTMEVTP